jgi:hypothetical protein
MAARPNVRLIASLRAEFKPRRLQIAAGVSPRTAAHNALTRAECPPLAVD